MKSYAKIGVLVTFLSLPFVVMADTITVPSHISPLTNSVFASASAVTLDWSDVFVGSTTAEYHIELSKNLSANPDGSFNAPYFVSSLLTNSLYSLTSTTPEGVYYWHVRGVDMTASSTATSSWSLPWQFTVDTTAPTSPTNLTLVSSIPPSASSTNGTQMWSFGTSTDTLSGIGKYQYAINSTTTWVDNGLSNLITTTLGVGTHKLAVRALDKAGNISSAITATFVVTSSSTVVTETKRTDAPTTMNQCKNGGWKTFTNPVFKNQGRCVSFVEQKLRDKKQLENKLKQEFKKKESDARKNAEKREKDLRTRIKEHEKEREDHEEYEGGRKESKKENKNFATTSKKVSDTRGENSTKNDNRGNGRGEH